MLIYIGVFIFSVALSRFVINPDNKFFIKRCAAIRAIIFALCFTFPIGFTFFMGDLLAKKVGKNFPTYNKMVYSDDFPNATIETYRPCFKKWKHYLIGYPSGKEEIRVTFK